MCPIAAIFTGDAIQAASKRVASRAASRTAQTYSKAEYEAMLRAEARKIAREGLAQKLGMGVAIGGLPAVGVAAVGKTVYDNHKEQAKLEAEREQAARDKRGLTGP